MPKTGKARSQSLTSQESYSAIIIADLVAEVQQQPETDKKVLSKVQEETNTDEGDVKPSDNSSDVDNTEVKTGVTNGTNIARGVVLNAAQCGQPDNNITVITTLALEEGDEEEEEEKPKKPNLKWSQMSKLRKIAFGFSFVPSIMFVLCFAVIFPCEKIVPLTKEVWSISLNHTEVTSRLKIAQNVFFSFITDAEPGLRSVDKDSGKLVWNNFTTSPSLFTECGNLAHPDSPSCLVMDSNGTLSLVDQLNGKNLWQINSPESEIPSFPAILPDCDNDGIDEIAVAVSKSKMKVVFLGVESYIDIPECESIPSNILIWRKKDSTDLLLSCQKEKNEILLRIPQSKWCKSNNKLVENISILMSLKTGILSQSKLASSEEGLTIWSEDTVTMFDIDGNITWAVSVLNHTGKNRLLFHGDLSENEKQVILYSSDIENDFQVTFLNFESGNVTLSRTIPNIEISEAVLIPGEKHDLFLGLMKKLTKSFKSEAEEKINKISHTVMHLLTKEDSNASLNGTSKIVEELILMQLDGSDIQTLLAFEDLEGEPYSTLFTAELREHEEKTILDVYFMRKAQGKKYTALERISVTHWDMSNAECAWKH